MREQDVMLGEGAGLASRHRGVGYCGTQGPVGVPALPLWGLTMNVRSLREEAGDGWCWVMFG